MPDDPPKTQLYQSLLFLHLLKQAKSCLVCYSLPSVWICAWIKVVRIAKVEVFRLSGFRCRSQSSINTYTILYRNIPYSNFAKFYTFSIAKQTHQIPQMPSVATNIMAVFNMHICKVTAIPFHKGYSFQCFTSQNPVNYNKITPTLLGKSQRISFSISSSW